MLFLHIILVGFLFVCFLFVCLFVYFICLFFILLLFFFWGGLGVFLAGLFVWGLCCLFGVLCRFVCLLFLHNSIFNSPNSELLSLKYNRNK